MISAGCHSTPRPASRLCGSWSTAKWKTKAVSDSRCKMLLYSPQPRAFSITTGRLNTTLQSVSCAIYTCRSTDPVQVRNGVNVTSVYIETEARDPTGPIIITETDFFSPVSTVPVNSAYSIWTLNLAGSPSTRYVGAEIDGVKSSMSLFTPLPALPSCPGS